MKWFRLYDELVDDPKVQQLPLELFRALINIWCVASQNDGRLPPIDAIAFKLRLPVPKTKKIVADLRGNGLIDEDENGNLVPHNWGKRQFKTDAADPTNADRQKRYRDSKRNGERNGESNGRRNGKSRYGNVTEKRPESDTETDSDPEVHSEQHPQNSGAARATATELLISQEAHAIADELGQAAGFAKENWPPGWCGAAYQIQRFLNDGCPGEVVKLAVTASLRRKRDGPPDYFSYFERPIATAFAQHKRPLPQVVVSNPQPIEIRNGHQSAGSFTLAAQRLSEQLSLQAEAEEREAASMDGRASASDDVVLSARPVRES